MVQFHTNKHPGQPNPKKMGTPAKMTAFLERMQGSLCDVWHRSRNCIHMLNIFTPIFQGRCTVHDCKKMVPFINRLIILQVIAILFVKTVYNKWNKYNVLYKRLSNTNII